MRKSKKSQILESKVEELNYLRYLVTAGRNIYVVIHGRYLNIYSVNGMSNERGLKLNTLLWDIPIERPWMGSNQEYDARYTIARLIGTNGNYTTWQDIHNVTIL